MDVHGQMIQLLLIRQRAMRRHTGDYSKARSESTVQYVT